jgi:hypothetical protein
VIQVYDKKVRLKTSYQQGKTQFRERNYDIYINNGEEV